MNDINKSREISLSEFKIHQYKLKLEITKIRDQIKQIKNNRRIKIDFIEYIQSEIKECESEYELQLIKSKIQLYLDYY